MAHNTGPVTMQHIADAAGVSVMTVSLALRNHQRISAATTARIHRLATDMGYRPNPMVSALMGQVRKGRIQQQAIRIGYLTLTSKKAQLANRVHRNYYLGAKARCNELGYTFTEFILEDDLLPAKRISKILRTRNIQGVVIAPLRHLNQRFELEWDRFSCAVLGNTLVTPPLHRAASHQYQSAKLLMDNIRQLGYSLPGFVLTASESDRVNDHFLAAFRAASFRYRSGREYPVYFQDNNARWEIKAVQHWLLREKPDIVIGSWGSAIYTQLKSCGIRIPQDVAYASVGYNAAFPNIASVQGDSVSVGKAAVDLVAEQLLQNERGIPSTPKTVLINGKWVDGVSAPKVCTHSIVDPLN